MADAGDESVGCAIVEVRLVLDVSGIVDVVKEDKMPGRPARSVAADVDTVVKNCVLGTTVHLLPLSVVIEVAISGLDIQPGVVQISSVVCGVAFEENLINLEPYCTKRHQDTCQCLKTESNAKYQK